MIPQERIEAEAYLEFKKWADSLFSEGPLFAREYIQGYKTGMLRALEIVKEDKSLIEKAPVMEDLKMLVKTLTKIRNIMLVAPTKAPLADSIILDKAQETLTAIKEKYGELK